MENVIIWGYSVKLADAIAFGALLVAGAALLMSVIALRVNRNSLSLYEGMDEGGVTLYVTNNSPHAVTLSAFGYLGPDGCGSSLLGDSAIRLRIDPRDECTITLNDEMRLNLRVSKGKYKWHCLYVGLATGHTFYDASRLRRWATWVLGWFNGARKRRHIQSEL
ncbi:hypothetical protein [Pseudomonas syringae]|uniref:hypothetical protein n=1 Tax=Pseudomonas syringae TaxID=317 RepID=UPI000515FA38|nr:hypothetical protein [Pseudomonas syringae]